MATSSSRFLYRSGRALRPQTSVESAPRPSAIPAGQEMESSPGTFSVFRRPPSWKVASSLIHSFQYAGMGVAYACCTQRNFRIHGAVAVVAVGLGVGLGLSLVEMALICITCGLVMALELLNTALEAVVDLCVGSEYHVLAKIAKDCAAGAVLISATTALAVAGLLLLPPLWQWFSALDLVWLRDL